jgi:hypothetical protein
MARILLGCTRNAGATYLGVQRRRRENCNRVTRSSTEHPRAARLLGILLVSGVKKHQGCVLLRVPRRVLLRDACAAAACAAACLLRVLRVLLFGI